MVQGFESIGCWGQAVSIQCEEIALFQGHTPFGEAVSSLP
jgi:hypothetical protein